MEGMPGEKSAIQEIPPGSGKYRQLVTIESPEILFIDVMSVCMGEWIAESKVEVDPLFVQACESNSIRVISYTTSFPEVVGFEVEGTSVSVRRQQGDVDLDREIQVIFVVCGTRLGRKGVRFARKTAEQARANDEFWGRLSSGKIRL